MRFFHAGVLALIAMLVIGWTFGMFDSNVRTWTLDTSSSEPTQAATPACTCSAEYAFAADVCGCACLAPTATLFLLALAAHAIVRSPPAFVRNACAILRTGLWACTCIALIQAALAWLDAAHMTRIVFSIGCTTAALQQSCVNGASTHAHSFTRHVLSAVWYVSDGLHPRPFFLRTVV